MDLVVAWLAFPALLLALCTGSGLLARRLAGVAVPAALCPALGLAVIVCVGQFSTLADATAELTAPLVVSLAIAGVGLSLPLRIDRRILWPVGVAMAVFAVYAAPTPRARQGRGRMLVPILLQRPTARGGCGHGYNQIVPQRARARIVSVRWSYQGRTHAKGRGKDHAQIADASDRPRSRAARDPAGPDGLRW